MEAIEREAMQRAARQFFSDPDAIRVAGLGVRQIMRLRAFYEGLTGKRSELIDDGDARRARACMAMIEATR